MSNTTVQNKTDTLTLEVSFQISIERIKDLLTSAFEGGSNYWIGDFMRVGKAKDYKKAEFLCDAPFVKGGCLRIVEDSGESDNDGKWFTINPRTITKGLILMAQKYPENFSDFMNGNDDAETADVFLQCVCFGEAIYG